MYILNLVDEALLRWEEKRFVVLMNRFAAVQLTTSRKFCTKPKFSGREAVSRGAYAVSLTASAAESPTHSQTACDNVVSQLCGSEGMIQSHTVERISLLREAHVYDGNVRLSTARSKVNVCKSLPSTK